MKKDDNFTIHLPAEQRLAFKKLVEAMGKTESEVGRHLVQQWLSSRLSEYRLLNEVFGENGSLGSISSQGELL